MADAIKKGRALGEAAHANNVYRAANSGNLIASIFYLKARCGWRDGTEREARVDVAINGMELSPDAKVEAGR
jgi:hypothetical protein